MGQTETLIAHNSLSLSPSGVWRWFAHFLTAIAPCEAPAMQQCYELENERSLVVCERSLGREVGIEGEQQRGQREGQVDEGGRKKTC